MQVRSLMIFPVLSEKTMLESPRVVAEKYSRLMSLAEQELAHLRSLLWLRHLGTPQGIALKFVAQFFDQSVHGFWRPEGGHFQSADH